MEGCWRIYGTALTGCPNARSLLMGKFIEPVYLCLHWKYVITFSRATPWCSPVEPPKLFENKRCLNFGLEAQLKIHFEGFMSLEWNKNEFMFWSTPHGEKWPEIRRHYSIHAHSHIDWSCIEDYYAFRFSFFLFAYKISACNLNKIVKNRWNKSIRKSILILSRLNF